MVDLPEHSSSAVRYPQMRQALLLSLQECADPAYQQRVWVGQDIRPGTVAGFEHTMSELFDGLHLDAADQRQFVGAWLLDDREAEAVAAFAWAFDRFWWPLEPRLSDAEIVGRPGWSGVVDAARATLRVPAPAIGFTLGC